MSISRPGPLTSSGQTESILVDLRFGGTNTRKVPVPYVIDMIIFGFFRVRNTAHTIALHVCYIRGPHRNGRFFAL